MEILSDELEARYRQKTTKELIGLTLEDITPNARTVVEKELARRNLSEKQRLKLDRRAENSIKRQVQAGDELAPLWKRLIAKTIDWLITVALLFPVSFFNGLQSSLEWAVFGILAFLCMSYGLAADALPNGQSLGKKIFGLTVIDTQKGGPCTLGQSLGRNFCLSLLAIVDLFPLVGKQRRRIGDIMAATSVRVVKR